MALTLRVNSSGPLTWEQMDANLTYLQTLANTANQNADTRQPASPKLSALATSVWLANQMFYTTGDNTLGMTNLSAFGRDLIAAETLNAARTVLSLQNVNNTADVDKPVSTLVQAALATKVDKVDGMGLSATSFTEAEKNKLAGLESSHYRGLFVTLEALQAGVIAPIAGDYGDVDPGAGTDIVRYIWDVDDAKWVAQSGDGAQLTPAQVKELYESNADTQAFHDADRTKLDGIAAGATANATNAELRDRSTHTGQQPASTISDLAAAVRLITLAGLPEPTSVAITTTDSFLAAMAKLQGQISANVTSIALKAPLPPSDGKTYGFKDGVAVEIASSSGSGRFFGELVMLPNRQSSPNGVVKADGQLISNASAQYPAVVADLQSATPSVPVVTAAVWLSDPTKRACWAYDSSNNQIRVPDWNGMQPGSIGPLFFRGDGNFGFVAGSTRMDQMQVITGTIDEGGAKLTASTGTTGAFAPASVSTNNRPSPASSAGYAITFDSSRVARTGGETFGKHGLGVWGVVLFGSVSNPGAADAAALATSYANQQTALNALNAALGFAYLYPNGGTQAAPANVASNSRYELANPFPGHEVIVLAEIQLGGKWGDSGWVFSSNGYGVKAAQLDLNTIIVQTGGTQLTAASAETGSPFGSPRPTVVTTAPCRVKVWRVKA